MKPQTIQFKKPKAVIQVFRNIQVYGKELKSFNDRKHLAHWDLMDSKSGYIENGQLHLPVSITENSDFLNCNLITIEDNDPKLNAIGVIYEEMLNVTNHCFTEGRKNQLDIFRIQPRDLIEFHLEYGYFEVGLPTRQNFKLCELQSQSVAEIKINGKTDSSMASRRERSFKEQHYIFQHLGMFNSCKVLPRSAPSIQKKVPEPTKTVDLLKTLW